jgi:hypothetical protein
VKVRKLLKDVVDAQFTRYATILEELEIAATSRLQTTYVEDYMVDGSCRLEDLGAW